MGLRVRYFVAEHDGAVTRVARSRYQRWCSKDEALSANRVGSGKEKLALRQVVWVILSTF